MTEKSIRALLDLGLTGVVLSSRIGELLEVNHRLCDILGYSGSELSGGSWSDILARKPERSEPGWWVRLCDGSGEISTVRKVLIRKDRLPVEVLISTMDTGKSGSNPRSYISLVQEIPVHMHSETMRSVLLHISQAVSHSDDLEQLLQIIHTESGRLIEATNFYVALYDSERDTYTFPYHVDMFEVKDDWTQHQLRKSLTDYVRKTGKPLLVDESRHSSMMARGLVEMVGKSSEIWMGSPLLVDKEVIGVVAVQSYDESTTYSSQDLELLTYISDNIAIAMERKSFEQALVSSEERLRTLQSNLPVGIYRALKEGSLLSANPNLLNMMGYETLDDLNGADIPEVWLNPEDRSGLLDTLKANGTITDFVTRLIRKDGSVFWASHSACGMFDGNRDLKYFDAVIQDVTDEKKAQQALLDKNVSLQNANEKLGRMARTDSLTGLLNRQYFMQRLQEEMDRSRRYKTPLSILLMDLDHFKTVNDTWGHLVGDAVLLAAVSEITSRMRDTDIAGRYGGDEFIMILTQTDLDGARAFAERLCKGIAATRHEYVDVSETCSIGVAELSETITDLTSFIKIADDAMYKAKDRGRNRACSAT